MTIQYYVAQNRDKMQHFKYLLCFLSSICMILMSLGRENRLTRFIIAYYWVWEAMRVFMLNHQFRVMLLVIINTIIDIQGFIFIILF